MTRRYWIGILILLATFADLRAAGPVNIIFIIGDDISWDDIGAYGNGKVKTPNLNALARRGIKFTNMFLTTSSCSPSRTSILTGRYPHNTGAAELHTPLPAHMKFFPELLKQKGYYTALAGKWHEGPATKRAYDTLLVNQTKNGEGGEEQWISLLKSRPREKPFFLWLAPYDAHRPWSPATNGPRHDPALDITVPPTLADTRETREDLVAYYNEIARLDHYVGLLEKELAAQDLSENTLIVFTADNGRPFPGSKTRLTDAGIKAPFLVKWPAGIGAGQTCQSLVSAVDIAPTLLAVAGIEAGPTFQGRSFASLFRDPAREFRKYVFAEHNWHDYEAYERAVRTIDFLYVINKRPQLDNGGPIDANQSPSAGALKSARKNGKLTPLQEDAFRKPRPSEEFFDNFKDPSQIVNVIENKTYDGQIESMRKVLAGWQADTGDTTPENLTPDWYSRETGEPLPAKGKRGEMPGASKHADRINAKGPF
ncbi:sulfatase [Dyadobacter sp. 676]|uniref:Sulfatase n=1 Tax=Dyadobacter sp. 676 TaxID=3088362 RepID=A0AAU8FLP6_9BACT